MRYLKTYEENNYVNYKANYEDLIDNRFVECNWCGWAGLEDEIVFSKEYDDSQQEDETCPSCDKQGYLKDIELFDEDFYDYIETHKPEKNIVRKKINDVDDLKEYYEKLYPGYSSWHTTNKYNL